MSFYCKSFGKRTKKQLEEELDKLYIELSALSYVVLDLGYKREFIEEKMKEKINEFGWNYNFEVD